MKIFELPSVFETLQDYVMKDNTEKVSSVTLDKGSKFNRCWYVKNARKDVRKLYGSVIKGQSETILSIEYMLLMKMHMVIGITKLDAITRKVESSMEMYKLDNIDFNEEYKDEIEELIRLYKKV